MSNWPDESLYESPAREVCEANDIDPDQLVGDPLVTGVFARCPIWVLYARKCREADQINVALEHQRLMKRIEAAGP